jgi:hypothetical protein
MARLVRVRGTKPRTENGLLVNLDNITTVLLGHELSVVWFTDQTSVHVFTEDLLRYTEDAVVTDPDNPA